MGFAGRMASTHRLVLVMKKAPVRGPLVGGGARARGFAARRRQLSWDGLDWFSSFGLASVDV
jgi:hypothetical protein